MPANVSLAVTQPSQRTASGYSTLLTHFAPSMKSIPNDDPLAIVTVAAIKNGDIARLQQLLNENETLADSCIHDKENGVNRSLLHIATDWPGHFPNVGPMIRLLIAAGADVNIGINGPNTETPLHWAASSNDVLAWFSHKRIKKGGNKLREYSYHGASSRLSL